MDDAVDSGGEVSDFGFFEAESRMGEVAAVEMDFGGCKVLKPSGGSVCVGADC